MSQKQTLSVAVVASAIWILMLAPWLVMSLVLAPVDLWRQLYAGIEASRRAKAINENWRSVLRASLADGATGELKQ